MSDRVGDLAAQDAYDVPLDQSTGVGWANRIGDVLQPFTNVSAGLGRDIPRAVNWFGEQARKPPEAAQADVRNTMGGLAEQLYTLPERTMGASEQMRTEGPYNPAPAVETALTMMGGGVAGTGEKAAMGSVLGSGPVRITSETAPISQSALRAKAKAEALHGKYPQYAEAYPEVGPPALLTKLEGGKAGPEVPYASMQEALAKDAEPGFFLSKKLTPEVEQFSKDRNIIQKNMDVYGYEPYFDPAKRFDVDPKNYAPFADTGTAAAPKTAKADAEWYAKYGTPENRAKLQEGYKAGKGVPDSENWYHMGQLEQEYIKHLGEKQGRAAFEKEFGGMMSATTGGAAPYDNLLMSQYANVVAKQGSRLPERAYEMPFPIGGRYASGNMAQAQKYIDSGMARFDPAVNPKRYDFSGAFTGNPMSATIDEQMYGALRPSTTKPSVGLPEWYGPATRVTREEAAKAGVDPRAFQDVTWAGLKKGKTGENFDYEGPMINHINRSIETTHRLTGMPREEIVQRGLIRKEIPLYAGAGDERVAAGLQGANALSQYKSSPGIRAYHSSPHDFDKFDLSKIGTGEGAQAYGHGLYFAENPAVSGQGGQYWNQFAHRFPEQEAEMAQTLQRFGFDRERAAAEAQKHIDMLERKFKGNPILGSGGAVDKEIAKRRAEIDTYASGQPIGPRTYEVNINADPAHMLDWDKSLAMQTEGVRDVAGFRDVNQLVRHRNEIEQLDRTIKELSGSLPAKTDDYASLFTETPQVKALGEAILRRSELKREVDRSTQRGVGTLSGSDLLSEIGLKAGGAGREARVAASERLREAGIPGIKYLDEGSRGMNTQILSPHDTVHGQWLVKSLPNGQVFYRGADEAAARAAYEAAPKPTSNYVIFDPSKIDIMKKYGIAGAAPAGMGVLAAQDYYQPEERM